MGFDQYSDYGSGSSTNSSSSWMLRDKWSAPQPRARSELFDAKTSSYLDLVMGRCTLGDVMREFRMNGSDSPYNPDEENIWTQHAGELSGMGPSAAYLRQRSWPAAERAPAPAPAPRPRSLHDPRPAEFLTSTPVFDESPPAPFVPDPPAPFVPEPPAPFVPEPADVITEEQTRVLSSLPDRVLFTLLRGLHSERRNKIPQECRFCKNNGERESFYRSHALKDAAGRVCCPVLRAFRCRRCGARGDSAHTIKYCPLSTNEERMKSAAMMRSVRMASGRRRHASPPRYVMFGALPSALPAAAGDADTPLDPLWAALEQKLSL